MNRDNSGLSEAFGCGIVFAPISVTQPRAALQIQQPRPKREEQPMATSPRDSLGELLERNYS